MIKNKNWNQRNSKHSSKKNLYSIDDYTIDDETLNNHQLDNMLKRINLQKKKIVKIKRQINNKSLNKE